MNVFFDEELILSLNSVIVSGWDTREKKSSFYLAEIKTKWCELMKRRTGETVQFPKEITFDIITEILEAVGWTGKFNRSEEVIILCVK